MIGEAAVGPVVVLGTSACCATNVTLGIVENILVAVGLGMMLLLVASWSCSGGVPVVCVATCC